MRAQSRRVVSDSRTQTTCVSSKHRFPPRSFLPLLVPLSAVACLLARQTRPADTVCTATRLFAFDSSSFLTSLLSVTFLRLRIRLPPIRLISRGIHGHSVSGHCRDGTRPRNGAHMFLENLSRTTGTRRSQLDALVPPDTSRPSGSLGRVLFEFHAAKNARSGGGGAPPEGEPEATLDAHSRVRRASPSATVLHFCVCFCCSVYRSFSLAKNGDVPRFFEPRPVALDAAVAF